MDIIILLLLWALLLLSGLVLKVVIGHSNADRRRHIDVLERQINENNRDITQLGRQLASVSEALSNVLQNNQPARAVALSTALSTASTTLSTANPAAASTDSSYEKEDLMHQVATLESGLRERDQQVSWLQMDVAKFKQQTQILNKRDAEIGSLTTELAQTRKRLKDALAEVQSLQSGPKR